MKYFEFMHLKYSTVTEQSYNNHCFDTVEKVYLIYTNKYCILHATTAFISIYRIFSVIGAKRRIIETVHLKTNRSIKLCIL